MDLQALRELIEVNPLADVDACRTELAAVRTMRGLLDAREMKVCARLDELASERPSIFPEDEVARASKTSQSKASRVRDRKKAADDVPELGAALAAGATTGDRLEQVARAMAGLSETERLRFAARGAELARVAGSGSDREFRQLLDAVLRHARADDGLARLARQRRDTRLRWWTDADGMWCLNGRFDPVNGALLEGRLRNTHDALFRDTTPDDCPDDPLEKQAFLAAHALLALSEGRSASGAPDVTVLIDEKTLCDGRVWEGSVVDAGLGKFGLPIETIRRWACIGSITPAVIGADGVRLFLGRETRLANRAQRRALRVLYRTCAMCDTPFEHCHIHHVAWYTLQHGPTDIDNLLPLCNRHHHLVHEGGWQLHLALDRTLTTTTPDGAVRITGPPRIRRVA
jgi:hypothetical protein